MPRRPLQPAPARGGQPAYGLSQLPVSCLCVSLLDFGVKGSCQLLAGGEHYRQEAAAVVGRRLEVPA